MTWNGRGSTRQWRKLRGEILERDPFCQMQLPGCTTISRHVDHVVNVESGGTDDPSNLRGVCPECHDVKTQAEAQAGRKQHRTKRTDRIPGRL